MKQKLFLFLFLILMAVALIALNAASYVQKEKTPDSELYPNRSTYNSGATGTQALYSLLSETGRKVIRWQEPPAALITNKNKPAVFVVTGALRREFKESEFEPLLQWVSNGGRLVLIDRDPPSKLVTTTANWRLNLDSSNPWKYLSTDASDQTQMTDETPASKPAQPTVFTRNINAIQPSRFAASIKLEKFDENKNPSSRPDDEERPTQPKRQTGDDENHSAPIVHFGSGSKNLLVEAPYGDGTIVFLADPFIVSNNGVGLADNAQLAINILNAGDGSVAFDEYHQGYGANNSQFLQFFEGTPVVGMFFQALLLVGLLFFSQSRRFARPVPEHETDRLSKLEYVSAMAELQERIRAYDLAIENIYTDFRRRVARLLGADNYTIKYDELAKLIAERTGLRTANITDILFKCEEIIRGEPTNKREVLELSSALRDLEQKLGLSRTFRIACVSGRPVR